MSDASSYRSSDMPSSDSHEDLLNQCLKSRTLELPLKSVARCSKRLASNVAAVIWVSPVELRKRFNRSGIVERALQENYTCCEKNKSREVTLPDGTTVFSMVLSFLDSEGRRRFNVHAHVNRDGTIASYGGRLDPKFMVDDDGTSYKLGDP